jgi:hypothetical protein
MHVELRLAPKARIDGRRCDLLTEERIVAEAPDDASFIILDLDLG